MADNICFMGFIFAIITSLFFTAYVVPKKLSAQTPLRYSVFQGIGFFAASAIAYVISRFSGPVVDRINSPVLLLSCLAGVIWYTGSVFLLIAIDKMGLSRSNQWKNLQGPFGALFNMIFLAEYLNTNVFFIFLASALILISAVFFNVKTAGEDLKANRSGIIFGLLAAVLFGFNSMLQKYVSSKGFMYSQLFCMSLFVMISSFVFALIREHDLMYVKNIHKKENLPGLSAGIIYFFAAFFSTHAYSLIPGSVAFTIIQLNAVWTVLIGVLVFKEIDLKKNRLRILAGIICAIAGVIVLLFA